MCGRAARRGDEVVDSPQRTNTAHQAQQRAAWLNGQHEGHKWTGAGVYEILPDAGQHKRGRRLQILSTVQLLPGSMELAAMHHCRPHSLVRPMNAPSSVGDLRPPSTGVETACYQQ